MSTSPRRHGPTDRPLLRLFAPTPPSSESGEVLTLTAAHKLLREPELEKRSKGYRQDCLRAVASWVGFEAALVADPAARQRIIYPLPIADITSSLVRRFQEWLTETTTLSPSSINKTVREVLTTIALAGDEGLEIRNVRCKRMSEPTGAKIWLDELQIGQLWLAAGEMSWPGTTSDRKRGNYAGTGLAPSTFWRAIIVLLRAYGIRVQDLVAYQRGKSPITWADITFEARTPNPHGREEWRLGWLYYQSGKVGRKYYLPLTKHTRAAIDRLHAAAKLRAEAAGLPGIPSDWPILPCPQGGALPRYWKALCNRAKVVKPIKKLGLEELGDKWVARTNVSERQFRTQKAAEQWLAIADSYVLEDFRSTAATFYATIEKTLPNKVCGWFDPNEKKNVGRTNYINDEPFLLKYLPGSYSAGERYFATEQAAKEFAQGRPVERHAAAPMPPCFDDWLD
jgi:hypothetical protein